MPRVSGGSVARNRRKKILKLAKGYYGSKHTLYRTANEQVMKSLQYSFRDRKQRKRDFRKLWIARINAGTRMHGLSYSRLTYGLKLANVELNRKMLSELAIHEPAVFEQIVNIAKEAIKNGVQATPAKVETKAATANNDYASMTVAELKAIAKEQGKQGISALKKAELIELLA